MGSATLNMTRGPVSGVVIPESDASTQGTLLTLAITQANLYIGNGATFDLDSKSATFGTVVLPASNDPTAVGFAVENGTFKIAVLTVGTGASAKKFTAVDASLGRAQLQGVPDVKIIATNLSLKLNRTSVVGGTVLNWTQAPLATASIALRSTDPTFEIGGTVGLAIADVAFGSATINVARSTVSGVDDPDDAGTKTLQGDLLTVSIRNARLYIGSGARLEDDASVAQFGTVVLPASNDPKAVGFSVDAGSLDLGLFTATRGSSDGAAYNALPTVRKYTGLQASLGKAQLQGVDAVTAIAWIGDSPHSPRRA
jgi:hypothetical protein